MKAPTRMDRILALVTCSVMALPMAHGKRPNDPTGASGTSEAFTEFGFQSIQDWMYDGDERAYWREEHHDVRISTKGRISGLYRSLSYAWAYPEEVILGSSISESLSAVRWRFTRTTVASVHCGQHQPTYVPTPFDCSLHQTRRFTINQLAGAPLMFTIRHIEYKYSERESGPFYTWWPSRHDEMLQFCFWNGEQLYIDGHAVSVPYGPVIPPFTYGRTELQRLSPKMDLVPDWDRNGVIDDADRDQASESNPFRFWINDDDDSGEVGNDDVPQQGNDADANSGVSGRVDGMRDLVDFFPLFFDLEGLLGNIDGLSTVNLKLSGQGMRFLKYDDGYAGFTPDEAGKFLRDVPTARELADNETRSISTDPHRPTDLGTEFVSLVSEGKGVLLLESYAATDQPLKLHVFVNGNQWLTHDFHLKTRTVEDMFEHRDLTGIPKNYDGSAATVPQSPAAVRTTAPNWPDERTNGKTFAFVHGYKVSGQAARGWHSKSSNVCTKWAAMRFVGITWNGDTGLDYHQAVFHAQTGQHFHARLDGALTIAAHSLGNMVVSQAIQSGSLIPNRYYMLNAATPNEAYGPGGSSTDMVEQDWTGLNASFYASNWYQQFSGGDARTGLKWVGAFSAVTQIETHNFYSPGEDILDVLVGDNDASVLGQLLTGNFNFTRGAWKSQELVKGRTGFGSLASLALSRGQAGWRLNSSYQTGDDIKEIPRFGPFLEADLHSSNAQTASDTATQNVRFDLLARGIPALSDAAAVATVPGVKNFDMEASGRDPNEWPSEDHSGESSGDWLHSDFRNVALPYVHLMYQHMINQGALNAN